MFYIYLSLKIIPIINCKFMDQISIKDHENEDAIIFLPNSEIDDGTRDIVKKLAKSDVFHHIRVMPDCHSSVNCCVGFTCYIHEKIIPAIVGGDIGCGISCYPLNKKIKENQYKKIDQAIKSAIPMGEKIHMKSIADERVMTEIYDECNRKLDCLKEKYPDYPFRTFNENYYKDLIARMHSKTNSSVFIRALGTLGGGNHYIEFNEAEDGKAYVTVHSGSRAIGQAICGYHQLKAKAKHDKKCSYLECYLQNEELVEYLIDMIFAQVFASKNREVMIEIVCDILGVDFDKGRMIETIHNYIDFDRLILRKGAIAAEEGKHCVISLNMRDGILICKGKGNGDWNYSSAHGCGRLMSRTDARHQLTMDKFKKEMRDVYSSSICKDTLDEAPMAYKDADKIKEYIGESVTIVKHLYPIINIKGY